MKLIKFIRSKVTGVLRTVFNGNLDYRGPNARKGPLTL